MIVTELASANSAAPQKPHKDKLQALQCCFGRLETIRKRLLQLAEGSHVLLSCR